MDFIVTKQALKLRLKQPILASDSLNFIKMTFYFDGSWDGLKKTASFCQDSLSSPIECVLDESNSCYLPNGLVAGEVHLSVLGVTDDGDKVGTTNLVIINLSESAYSEDATEV